MCKLQQYALKFLVATGITLSLILSPMALISTPGDQSLSLQTNNIVLADECNDIGCD